MEILKEIKNRYSVKNYLDKEVEKDKLMRIVEAGALSPSAKNRQSWRFIVITKDDVKKRIEEHSYNQDFISKAGAIIALCTTNVNYKMPNGEFSYPIDLGIASAFMMLQAQSEGLATCPIGIFDHYNVSKVLTVPYSMKIALLLLVGYEKKIEEPFRDRIPLSKIISFDHW